MNNLDANYWENRYQQGETGWDIGSASNPLISYCEQRKESGLEILIPGCGNAHEAATLMDDHRFSISLLDIAASPLQAFRQQHELAVAENRIKLYHEDFFAHQGKYDLILEQTFFCALDPGMRKKYADKMYELLNPGAKLVGLLFNFPLTHEGPPFGGSTSEYLETFSPYFTIKTLEPCYNSIPPRNGRELFFIMEKKA